MIAQQFSFWTGSSTPNTARIHDYFLGGKDNFAIDRKAAARIMEKLPDAARLAQAHRCFLARAAEYCARRHIDQFLDIGTGIPAVPAIHDLVRAIRPAARIVGTEHDPVALCHARALTDDGHRTRVIEGNPARPGEILTHPTLARLIDLRRPVAVLLTGVLDAIPDDRTAATAMAAFRARLAPGSYLVLSHATTTGSDPQVTRRLHEVYAEATSPAVFRTRYRIDQLLDGLDLVAPGLVDVQRWHPTPATGQTTTALRILGAVARTSDPAARDHGGDDSSDRYQQGVDHTSVVYSIGAPRPQ